MDYTISLSNRMDTVLTDLTNRYNAEHRRSDNFIPITPIQFMEKVIKNVLKSELEHYRESKKEQLMTLLETDAALRGQVETITNLSLEP